MALYVSFLIEQAPKNYYQNQIANSKTIWIWIQDTVGV